MVYGWYCDMDGIYTAGINMVPNSMAGIDIVANGIVDIGMVGSNMAANDTDKIEMYSGDIVMPWLLKEWSVLTWLPITWLLLTWMFCDLAVIDRAANGLGGIEADGSYDHM